jgi:hypothetical protein
LNANPNSFWKSTHNPEKSTFGGTLGLITVDLSTMILDRTYATKSLIIASGKLHNSPFLMLRYLYLILQILASTLGI